MTVEEGAEVYKRILVAVDGSEPSARALEEALALASGRRRPVTALHAQEAPVLRAPAVPDAGPGRPSLKVIHVLDDALDQNELFAHGKAVLTHAVERAGEYGVTAESEMLPAEGRRISDVILKAAKGHGADLIVLGSHGSKGLRQVVVALLGSVAEEVIGNSMVPVMLPGRTPDEM